MPDASHVPIPIENWRGIYSRSVADATPPEYFQDSLNCKFNDTDVYTRDGSTRILEAPDLVRFAVYKRLGETIRHIWLNTSGQLFDSLFPGTPIWTDVSYVDFSMGNFNNRAYITPHNRRIGIPGKFVLVYDGSGAARLAGGAAPSGFTLTVANSATSGDVEAGTHLFAVAFESDTGFITAPGPTNFTSYVALGGLSVDIGAIPALPAGMVAVRILATKAIQEYNGNQEGYEYFLIDSSNGGRVTGGASTTTISFFDVQLIVSATYLFDNRGLIPAGVCLANYKGRMCIAGINGDEHSVYVSAPYDPEQMSAVTGFITVDPFESGDGIRNLFPFRGQLIICKPNRLYSVIDNQDEPVTWIAPDSVDVGVGTECFGVGLIQDSKGQQNDRAWIADTSGLILFEGYARQPEASWLVKEVWDRINKSVFNKVQVAIDTEFKQIFVAVPLDGSTSISHILYGYYGSAYGVNGFDPKLIRWSIWESWWDFSSITVDINPITNSSVLKYSGADGHIYSLDHDYSVHNDETLSFESYVKTGLYTTKPNYSQHCCLINLRVQGNGILHTDLYSINDVKTVALQNKTMSAQPTSPVEIKADFTSIKIAARFRTGLNIDEYFKIIRADLYLKPMWLSTNG